MDNKTKSVVTTSVVATAVTFFFFPTIATFAVVGAAGVAAWKTWGHKLTSK